MSRIQWTPNRYGHSGHVGKVRNVFCTHGPAENRDALLFSMTIAGLPFEREHGTEEEAYDEAERMLVDFVERLGAKFPEEEA